MASFGGSDNTVGVLVKTEADTSGITETEQAVGGLNNSVDESTQKHTDWAGSIQKAGAMSAVLLGTIGFVTKGAIDQASAYQQNRVAFEVMLGSADKAKTLLRQISDFAAQTPFQLPDVVEGAKNLLAFGFSANQIIPTFSTLGNIASAVGTDKLPNIVAVFGQIKVAGRAMTQDLMQFTSAGVPIIDELAKHYGTTTENVRKLTEQGKVGFSDVQAALEQLGGPSGKWGDLMAKQSQTFGGTMSNVSDQLGRILRQAVGIGPDGDIRRGSLFDVAVKGANALLGALNTLTPMFDSIANFFEHNKIAVQALVGVLGGLLLGTLVAIVVAIGWIPFAIMGAAAVIGAVVSVIIANFDSIKNFIGGVVNAIGGFFSGMFGAIGGALDWLGGHWIEVLGFMIGFVATLPIKIPLFFIQAFVNAINWIGSIKWGDVFGAIGRAAVNAGNDIWNAISGAWNKVMGINWGAVLVNIGKGLGNALIDLINGAIKGAFSGIPILKDHVPQLPHFASGVRNFSGGLAVVGEQGPEIIDLPRGSNVYTNQQSKQMAAKGGVTMNNTYHIYNQTDFDAALKEQGWRIANAT